MSLRPILGLAAGLLAATSAFAQTITPAMLREHIAILASDDYEGREPGTAGGERTEAYVIQAFAAAGLKPGAPGGRWRQEVALTSAVAGPATVTVRRGATASTIAPGDIVVIGGSSAQTRIAGAPLVFVGNATPAVLANLDLKGKVAVALPGARGSRKAILATGAAGVLIVLPATAPWSEARGSLSHNAGPVADLPAGFEGYLPANAAAALFGDAASATAQFAAGAKPEFRATPLNATIDVAADTVRRRFTTANIVGMIPGTARPNEAVMLSAHWDHIGICRPEGTADRICNGAADNASGTAILIETAHVLAKGPASPRSVYFVATTAEEMGMLGADAYAAAIADTPLKVVANLNIDTTAIGPAGLPVAMVGRGNHPKIDAIVDQTARAIGRKVDTDTEANIMVQRQDGWAFGKRGIPAVMATGSVSDMKGLFAYLDGPYHKPSDDLSHLELGGAAEDADLHVALARALADPARYPAN